ncbi:hypothetical protein HanXRQr2_Chr03g0089241 [Helianthus annuus]|uniref:Uncharacterized protein n=1 Tax=Helianthus annuus TaxID=4232 RepID=A0A9K3JE07_HELAN|nr:hypothetical protein HanXRQr2_Chr15g0681761 [Helianthus annuus]KAF5812680.1 hypothetical protein HanXRQr2_Chr03g0089241 [Helianthus annuus]KAJ0606501.1 hypothetical protein HanHA89_Chr03g0085841 [Helianthus annuus]KAJ0766599.1 hypothetical protein HanLR1_Chr03g0079381 [Helianthus annuus]KAJ0941923.1 hypothetical protein HanPSC8_Chr03g0085801 [Helianthus annuus]
MILVAVLVDGWMDIIILVLKLARSETEINQEEPSCLLFWYHNLLIISLFLFYFTNIQLVFDLSFCRV